MITAQAQRTLVKSPPELWSELSDPAALARHLGELGEITITRVEPEHKVEWESDGASGVVELKPSGWGTKVTLSLTRDDVAPSTSAAAPDPVPAPTDEPGRSGPSAPAAPMAVDEPSAAAEPAKVDEASGLAQGSSSARTEDGSPRNPSTAGSAQAVSPSMPPEAAPPDRAPEPAGSAIGVEPIDSGAPEPPTAQPPEPALSGSRQGFLARLLSRLGRRGQPGPDEAQASPPPSPPPASAPAESAVDAVDPVERPAAETPPGEPRGEEPCPERGDPLEVLLAPATVPSPPAAAEQEENPAAPDIPAGDSGAPDPATPASNPDASNEEESTELLKAVLDSLGEAHHRPFSRS